MIADSGGIAPHAFNLISRGGPVFGSLLLTQSRLTLALHYSHCRAPRTQPFDKHATRTPDLHGIKNETDKFPKEIVIKNARSIMHTHYCCNTLQMLSSMRCRAASYHAKCMQCTSKLHLELRTWIPPPTHTCSNWSSRMCRACTRINLCRQVLLPDVLVVRVRMPLKLLLVCCCAVEVLCFC